MTVFPIHLRAFCLVKLSAVRQPDWSATSTLLAAGLMERQPSEVEDLWKPRRGKSYGRGQRQTVSFSFPRPLTERLLVCVRVVFVWRPLSGSTWTSQRSTATWPAARPSCRAPSSPCRGRTAASRSCTTKCRWERGAARNFTLRAAGGSQPAFEIQQSGWNK